jgi:hypothetical protein
MIIVTVTMVGLAGYLIIGDMRQRQEIEDFRQRMAGIRWETWQPPSPVVAEVED